MSDLTEFLLARIAEDEADARRWQEFLGHIAHAPVPGEPSPGRLFAEVEAKLRIVEDSPPVRTFYGLSERAVLRHLASIYSDHPDYDPSWRPD